MNKYYMMVLAIITSTLIGCGVSGNEVETVSSNGSIVLVQAESFVASSDNSEISESIDLATDQWLSYEIDIPVTGRYLVEIAASGAEESAIWIEDYIGNKDNRTYDITGKLKLEYGDQNKLQVLSKYGSPLRAGTHNVKLHASSGQVSVDWMKFSLQIEHTETPVSYTQKMEGEEWSLVWSDEFEGSGLPDTTKWSYNVGNWGWGNNEKQYYTKNRVENARQEGGNLIIEAIKNDLGEPWTSTRLTTQGKESFLYGKIEFRAKVPVGRGTWAAGWTLGDEYLDELSWPYCGEIDILECVGYEIDDETGSGLNHATCHTRAYYFKQENQIGSEIAIDNMDSEFHTYGVEWYPDVVYGLVDGERYYTYDKNANELEWPFNKPQNIILNLAVGGGWGGAQGIDETWDSHKYIIDYVRVYELK